ncbi:hypothetical protein HDR61_04700 [bacterium]|nr:hypothetical protein [bacterium]
MAKRKKFTNLHKLEKAERHELAKIKDMQKDHNFLWEHIFKLATGQIDKEIKEHFASFKPEYRAFVNLKLVRDWAKSSWENYEYVNANRSVKNAELSRQRYLVERLEMIYEEACLLEYRICPYWLLLFVFTVDSMMTADEEVQ